MAEIKVYRWPKGKVHALCAVAWYYETACDWTTYIEQGDAEDADDSEVTCLVCKRVLESELRRKKWATSTSR